MFSFQTWIRQRPIVTFYLLAVALSWSYWLVLLTAGFRVEAGSSASHLPGLLGPMIAAGLVSWFAFGPEALRDLVRRAITIPLRPVTGSALAVTPILAGMAVFAVLPAQWPPLAAFAEYPGLPQGLPLWGSFCAALLLNGFGEEVGWRGFATHHLFERLGRFRATWVVAILWLFWHAPLFWLVANMHALLGPVLIGWALGLLSGAFVLAAMYLATRSILVVAVWHTLFNFVVATPPGTGQPAAIVSTVVMIVGAFVIIHWWRDLRRNKC